MSKFQTFWTNWKPRLVLLGACGFVIAVVVVVVALIIGPGGSDKPADKNSAGGNSRTTGPHSGSADEGTSGQDGLAPAPKLGKDGLAEMEITKDPRVAAASAAQVLMSGDMTKLEWVEAFREETLSRVMRPSPEYVGPGSGMQIKEFGGDKYDGDELFERAPQMLAKEKYSPTGWWWLLGDTQSFGGFSSYGATLTSRAIEVYDQEEMAEFTGGASWTKPSDAITIDIDPEASFGLYWARVETTTTAGDDVTTLRNPVALAVYCDPPALGGLCGVAALMTRYPDAWQTSY